MFVEDEREGIGIVPGREVEGVWLIAVRRRQITFDEADVTGIGFGFLGPRLHEDGAERAPGLLDREDAALRAGPRRRGPSRSEEHTSELQSLMRPSYAVF